MFVAILAVVGTLAGAALSGAFALRTAGRAERAVASEQLRRDRLDAVTTLAAAGSDHRRAMWNRGEAELARADQARLDELRAASHVTRSAITRPLVAVQILVPDRALRAAASEMVVASYRMRDAYTSIEALAEAREAARTAHDQFIDRAAAYLTAV
ncbi:hypothetical protein ACFQ7N_10745 [Streptomyces niveus]|uniref:hypothetical protein n=1 Tax=Streptomyces niveus TaxID=193462 RepID=UPI0036993826